MVDLIPLCHLQGGASAEVADLVGEAEQIHRLEEMGFRRGAVVEMVSAGSPCIVKVLGSKFCFRDAQLLSVLVRPGATQ
ncbi:MAG: ferrous iron transport protein A [Planctomycetes bacterium]|nr:ferrous iron transport protein A [Planctomycetota bacterium]